MAAAKAAGQRYKLIASATPTGGSVKATRLPLDDPLASVGGATNAITLETDLLGDITLIGPGAGKRETGSRHPGRPLGDPAGGSLPKPATRNPPLNQAYTMI